MFIFQIRPAWEIYTLVLSFLNALKTIEHNVYKRRMNPVFRSET